MDLHSICKKLYTAQDKWPEQYPQTGEAGELWEQVCATMLLLHGRPPPHPGFGQYSDPETQKERNAAYIRRNDWIMCLEKTLADRYRLHPGLIGPFIAAYEKWCSLLMEDE